MAHDQNSVAAEPEQDEDEIRVASVLARTAMLSDQLSASVAELVQLLSVGADDGAKESEGDGPR